MVEAPDSAHPRDRGYQAALKLSPGNSQLITYIGQTYEEEYNHNEAKKWYKKAIKTNRLEYLAHWFLADIHYSEGDTKEAVYEITIAHILNRNNSSVIERLLAIYSNQGIEYLNWDFDPIYELSKNEDNSISLRYDPKHSEWVSYALCKAVWAYEPGYKDNMLLDTPNIPSLVEEVECFLNVIIAFNEKYGNQKSDDEAVNRLIKAFEKNYITEFVIYEKLLIEDPLIAYLIDKESIDMVVDYILKFRTKKI